MSGYRIGKLSGKFVLVFEQNGKRRRFRLTAKDAHEAHRVAPGIYAELTRPKGTTVAALWEAYTQDKAGRAVVVTMTHTWKALRDRFGPMDATSIIVEDSREHMKERRAKSIADGTLLTELGHLRMVLKWAEKKRLIDRAPHIERPTETQTIGATPNPSAVAGIAIRRDLPACEVVHRIGANNWRPVCGTSGSDVGPCGL